MGGSLLAAASAGDCRNVKGPCPALRPGRLRGAFRFRELVPCFGPRPAAFNSLRSCSFSPRRRSISLPACSNCSRKPRFSASYSFSCLRRSPCLEPSIAPYRDTKPPKCPAFSANQLLAAHKTDPFDHLWPEHFQAPPQGGLRPPLSHPQQAPAVGVDLVDDR